MTHNDRNVSAPFRSKYAGLPGSVSAIRVNYGGTPDSHAFEALQQDHPAVEARRAARRWAQGPRLGQARDWNASTATPTQGPEAKRALMHQMSQFQAAHIEYNYRSQQLPTAHRSDGGIASGSHVGKLSGSAAAPRTASLAPTMRGTVTQLSLFEMPVTEDPALQDRERSWNPSNALSDERASVFVPKKYESLVKLNQQKQILHPSRYVRPEQAQIEAMEAQREVKRQTRASASAAAATPAGPAQPLKLSNMDTWWDRPPPHIAQAVATFSEAAHQRRRDAELREVAEAEARAAAPTSLRVVASE